MRYIPITEWAETLAAAAKSPKALRRLVRYGLITPPPVRIGRVLHVEPTAMVKATARPTLVDQIRGG